MEDIAPLSISDIPDPAMRGEDTKEVPAMVLSLSCEWLDCVVKHCGGPLLLKGAPIIGGMSGSPIITPAGAALGMISTSAENGAGEAQEWNGPWAACHCRSCKTCAADLEQIRVDFTHSLRA
jgi:hypothetical protein